MRAVFGSKRSAIGEPFVAFHAVKLRVSVMSCVVVCMLMACEPAQDEDRGNHKASPTIVIEDAYYRLPPPGLDKTAAYMTIKNAGDAPIELLAVTSPRVRAIEIHQIIEKDGQMKMRRQQSLAIAASDRVELAPGGLHLMLFGLEVDRSEETALLPLVLSFEDENGTQRNLNVHASPKDLRH